MNDAIAIWSNIWLLSVHHLHVFCSKLSQQRLRVNRSIYIYIRSLWCAVHQSRSCQTLHKGKFGVNRNRFVFTYMTELTFSALRTYDPTFVYEIDDWFDFVFPNFIYICYIRVSNSRCHDFQFMIFLLGYSVAVYDICNFESLPLSF